MEKRPYPRKAVTFSYDDGVTQDIRLIEIFNRYGLKSTFNLNSQLLGKEGTLSFGKTLIAHNKNKASDVRSIYDGHEVAVHTLTHPFLPGISDDREIIRQVEQDRLNLSELAGYEVCGMAYPCGGKNNDARTAKLIREHTGVRYARALETNGRFSPQEDLFRFQGTLCHHEQWDLLLPTAERFLAMQNREPAIFYIWGHSYEFDIFPERWELFEAFCRMISGRSDVFYGTNKEVLLDWAPRQ